MVNPANLRTNGLAPPVVIENVSVDSVSAGPFLVENDESAVYRIPPGKQRFEFRFTGLSFIASHRLHNEFARIEKFKRKLGQHALYHTYTDLKAFEDAFRQHLAGAMNDLLAKHPIKVK